MSRMKYNKSVKIKIFKINILINSMIFLIVWFEIYFEFNNNKFNL